MIKSEAESQEMAIRDLTIEELEAVVGGVMEGGCIRLPNILHLPTLPQPAPFKDVFAKYTIG